MAKVTSIFTFTGTVDGLSFYTMQGVEEKVGRKAWGPSKEDIETKPSFSSIKKHGKEHGGCSKASKWLRRNFQPLTPARDHTLSGPVTTWLKPLLDLDTENLQGQRHVMISRNPRLLEGINLSKRYPFDSVVRNSVDCTLDRNALSARLQMPALLPGLTFAPMGRLPFYRIVASLGAAPDVFWTPHGYAPQGDYGGFAPAAAYSEWIPAATGSEAVTFELTLPYTPPTEHFSLVLTVGILMGTIGKRGRPEAERYQGCGKVVGAV